MAVSKPPGNRPIWLKLLPFWDPLRGRSRSKIT